MNSHRYRNPHGASRALQALRLDGLPALVHAEGSQPGLTMRARWSGKMQPIPATMPRFDKFSWLPRIAGVLAFGALAFGIFLAGSDDCAARETDAAGSYSQSTLAPITATGTTKTGLHGGNCRHKHGRPPQQHKQATTR
ncbi:hypothetical protein [Variovorax sp. W6]|uniref:hypothetical protein n=1 Tax=Variovorax sp. W6 TaxID=3093895 RepID=UPI003D80394E